MTKKCNCCGLVQEIPKETRPWIDQGVQLGFFFECPDCSSTMLILTIDKTKIKPYHLAQAQ